MWKQSFFVLELCLYFGRPTSARTTFDSEKWHVSAFGFDLKKRSKFHSCCLKLMFRLPACCWYEFHKFLISYSFLVYSYQVFSRESFSAQGLFAKCNNRLCMPTPISKEPTNANWTCLLTTTTFLKDLYVLKA